MTRYPMDNVQTYEMIKENLSPISNDLGAVMRDVKLLNKWRHVIEMMNQRVNNLQEQLDHLSLNVVRVERQAEYDLPSIGSLNKTLRDTMKITDLTEQNKMLQNKVEELEHRLSHLLSAAPRNKRLDEELINGGCKL